MSGESLKKQALLTAGGGALTRAMGFGLRLFLSRTLGAEALGIMELASGAHMLALTPGTAGLPGAVSRLTARADTPQKRRLTLYAARRTVLKTGLILAPLFFLLSPMIARLLGDERALPSLWLFSPCVLFAGLSAVYDGAFFGRGRALPPAVRQLTEQAVRLAAVVGLAFLVPRLTAAYRAALPALASTAGEGAGLLAILALARKDPPYGRDSLPMNGPKENLRPLRNGSEARKIQRELWRLSLPALANRLCHTGLRSLCNVIIPLRLMAGGLGQREAMSRLGMLGGMVMPLMLLPGLISGALSVVGGPAVARCRTKKAENRLAARLLLSALGTGLACCGALYALAPYLSARLYRLPELTHLLRAACPLSVILPVQQTVSGLLTGLGLQKRSLAAGLLGAAATLLCTWQWTPFFGILGSAYAAMVGHALTMACEMIHLLLR